MGDNVDWLAVAVGRGLNKEPCSRDHCTPEERAVIDAAIADREALKDVSGGNVAKGIDRAIAARNILLRAVNELIIARDKSKEQE